MLLKPFVLNSHNRIIFPCNFFPELDFSVFQNLTEFSALIRRDFGEKALTEDEILSRLQAGEFRTKYELCRELALNLFWVNRYVLTMYEKRPTRWGELPRHRNDIFLPVYMPHDDCESASTLEAGYHKLPATWEDKVEDHCFRILLEVFRNKLSSGGEIRPIKYTVAEILADPHNLTCHLLKYEPDYPVYEYDEIVNYEHSVPELEALMRQTMILHNQYPWDPAHSRLKAVGKLKDDDYVIAFHPRNHDILQFIQRAKHNDHVTSHLHPERPRTLALSEPVKPLPPMVVRDRFRVMPRVEAITVYKGEIPCTNEDLIRNHAYCWSHMTAAEIFEKTGIAERCYSELSLPDMALLAAREALTNSGRKPAEIGAVLFCSCSSTKLVPSVATWLSGELGIYQTHASCDIVAACAGMSYGLGEAIRLLQEIERPVLVICAEKFSDKIGTVRTSRMIFGDGAAAVIVAPAPPGAPPDIEVVQTYASGPWSEVNSIVWPNPLFDNNLTVYGPDVKALVKRYLTQMINELKALPHPNGTQGTLMDAIDLVVPHQANKNMVASLAEAAGIAPERLYFNIERIGNTSAASILLAIHDAVEEKQIDRPMRIFAPAFGAGAVGGYVVMRIDPAVVQYSSQEKKIMETPVVHTGHHGNGHNGFHSLQGKVALVTGASRGIGKAIALELAHRGANVAVDYRVDATHANEVAEQIRALGVECLVLQGDIGHKEDVHRIVKEVLDKWQRLDILVNNAGITRDHSIRKMTDEEWAEVINVNLSGTFYCTREAVPAMINQRFGRIINISSMTGQSGNFGQTNYAASKGGIIAFTKALALELARYNITANTIAPGWTATEMSESIPEEVVAQAKARIPLGRFGTPEEVAKAAGFLATDGDYITGEELNVNGGAHLGVK
jgi:3-oxoacyl-[acyl-carrier-protein] synthase III